MSKEPPDNWPLVRLFGILVVFGTLPVFLFRSGMVVGAGEQLACSDHCAAVAAEDPAHGGRGVLDARGDHCHCERGEIPAVAAFDKGDGYVPERFRR